MKFYTLYLILFASLPIFAQVGINTAAPEATLETRAINHLGAVTAADGLLVPRVNSLATNGSTNGQLIYLIQDAGIFKKGFHFWNGSAWKSVTKQIVGDADNDEWANDNLNQRVHLPKLSNGITARPATADFSILDNGKVGIGTATPMGALEIVSTNSGMLFPRMTSAQRNSLSVNNRQGGTMIYNTTENVMQANTGTSDLPIWEDLTNLISDTQNTYVIWQKTTGQTTLGDFMNFNTAAFFNNMPVGYISRTTANTWTLEAGKTYEINYDQGYTSSGFSGSRTCKLYVNGVSVDHTLSQSVPNSTSGYLSGGTIGMTIYQPSSPAAVRLYCSSPNTTTYGSDFPYPWISFKILD